MKGTATPPQSATPTVTSPEEVQRSYQPVQLPPPERVSLPPVNGPWAVGGEIHPRRPQMLLTATCHAEQWLVLMRKAAAEAYGRSVEAVLDYLAMGPALPEGLLSSRRRSDELLEQAMDLEGQLAQAKAAEAEALACDSGVDALVEIRQRQVELSARLDHCRALGARVSERHMALEAEAQRLWAAARPPARNHVAAQLENEIRQAEHELARLVQEAVGRLCHLRLAAGRLEIDARFPEFDPSLYEKAVARQQQSQKESA